jgi:class 3 adenylate cyclase
VMEAIVNQAVVAREHVASLGGGFAILSFTDAQQAVDMSMSLRDRFVESGLPVKIGIDAGRVLMFARQRGPSGISGSPVNMASKISEDVGIVNMVSITTRVADHVRGLEGAAPFTARISNVGITGVRV